MKVPLQQARRLVLTKQRLSGPLPKRPDRRAIVSVIRDLGYVQWDPVNVVAPAHEVTLWSRLGPFRRTDLERVLWRDRTIFRGWGHSDSLLLTEDYPLHYSLMRRYPESLSDSWGNWKRWTRRWLPRHRDLRERVLEELQRGPRRAAEFPEHARTRSSGDGWSAGSDVTAMLFHLWMGGEVMIVGHDGRENLWGLSRRFLPDEVGRDELPVEEVERRVALRAARALPFATRTDLSLYYPRGRYLDLRRALEDLVRESRLSRVTVEGVPGPEPRYVDPEDLAQLGSTAGTEWIPRTTLLSPFDNLTTCRGLLKQLFDFEYIHENFVPKPKRRFGVYVLPILGGDRLIGRIAPRLDRERRVLEVEAVYAEPDAPRRGGVAAAVAEAISRLADFVGAERVEYSAKVPPPWRRALS